MYWIGSSRQCRELPIQYKEREARCWRASERETSQKGKGELMSTDEYRTVLDQALRLTPEEQLQLIEDIITVVRHQVRARHQHSIMEFEGVGKEVWEGIDVEKYIDEERNSWER